MFAFEPSQLYPMAVNCSAEPTAKLSGGFGVTKIEDSVITDKVTGGLVIPFRVAVISVVPTARPVAEPPESMVANLFSELFHSIFVLISAVVPFV
jgi:hypothetical protein